MSKASQQHRFHSDHGFAIGPLLFIIAILAIIGGVIASGSQGFTSGSKNEASKVMAQSIIDYAEQVKSGFNIVSAHGCGDTSVSTSTISFQPQGVADYVNAYAPTDNSCNIFSQSGGGIAAKPVPYQALDTTWAGYTDYGSYAVYKDVSLSGVGQTDQGNGAGLDLVLAVPYLRDDVCQQLAQMLTGNAIVPAVVTNFADASTTTHFAGDFATSSYATAVTQPTGCINTGFKDLDLHSGNPITTNVAFFTLQAR